MSDVPITLDLFVEDAGHQRFLDALIPRVAADESIAVLLRTQSARGGHGRALRELELSFKLRAQPGDVLVVAIDANCKGWNKVKNEIEALIPAGRYLAAAIACPDPHVERWYLADPGGLARSELAVKVKAEKRKCKKDHYKHVLEDAFRAAGHPIRLGGVEFALEIVEAMDLYRAGKSEPSLARFLEALRAGLRVARDARRRRESDD